MLHTILNKKGISIVEAMIAVFLTTIAVISLLPMQDTSVKTAFKSDYLSRATGILQAELEWRENQIMSGVVPASPINQQIKVSGLPGNVTGDATFNMVTTTRVNPAAPNSWIVNARVTWTGNNNGIASSILVTPQMDF